MACTHLKNTTALFITGAMLLTGPAMAQQSTGLARALENAPKAKALDPEELDRICEGMIAAEICRINILTQIEAGTLEVGPDGKITTEFEFGANGEIVVIEDPVVAETETEAEGTAVLEAEAPTVVETEVAPEVVTEAESETPTILNEELSVSDSQVEPIVEGAKTVEVTEDQVRDDGNLVVKLPEGLAAALEVAQEDTAESTEAANTTVEVAATAAGEGSADETEVTTTVVAENEVRSSTEDFDTKANRAADSGDDGLRDFATIALGIAGAAALGKIIGDNETVVSNSGDRLVVERDGEYRVLKNDDVLLRRPGSEVQTQTFDDGSSRTTILRPDGVRVITVRAADGQVLRRTRILADGTEVVLFDDTLAAEPVQISELPTVQSSAELTTTEDLRAALRAVEDREFDRRFTLQQVRQIRAVRELMPVIELEAINFATASAAIQASEAEELRDLGVSMRTLIEASPNEVFLVEGHTDAVGAAGYNLALSDRRAESVALALTEYFDVPPENMVVQGYGESNLKVQTLDAERANRRATVRRITPLLQSAQLY